MSIDLSPGTSTSLFAVPASAWTALNRRAALVSAGWTPDYARQFDPALASSAAIPAGYDYDTYVTQCGEWCATYFPQLVSIAQQTNAFAGELEQLANDAGSLTDADFAARFTALQTALQTTDGNVRTFCDFFAAWLGQTESADTVAASTSSQFDQTYALPLATYFDPLGSSTAQVAAALQEFSAGWIALLDQFESGSQLITNAAGADGATLATQLDLSAANVAWQGEGSTLSAFATMAAAQSENFTGEYLANQFFPAVVLRTGYFIAFNGWWLEVQPNPPFDVGLRYAPQSQLFSANLPSWVFEPIPGGFGSCYMWCSQTGPGLVLSTQFDPAIGGPAFQLAPRAPVPVNGWRILNSTAPGGGPSLTNASQGLVMTTMAEVQNASQTANLTFGGPATPGFSPLAALMNPGPASFYTQINLVPV